MAPLKAVFFDLGGTLMDDEGDRAAKVAALAAVNARYRIPRTGEETLRWFLKDLGPYYAGQPENDALHVEMCRLYPDAIPAVVQVRATGLHVGLLTDVDEKFVRPILEAVRLAPLLDSLTTSEAVGVGKPNPRIFRAALEAAACAPRRAIVVGDSRTRDVAGAKAAGMLALFLHRAGERDPAADFHARTLLRHR